MQKTKTKTARRRAHPHIARGLNSDLAKIKAALAGATYGVKNRTGKLINQQISEVRDTTADLKTSVEDYVIDKPLKSIGIAGLIGVAIGLYMRS